MKKFFVTILIVSTFFIGLGALVDRAGATLKSDAKATELIRQARIAIGGDANIENVRSLTIAGNSTYFFNKDGVPQTEQGTLEINLQLPTNRFSKMVRIGNPESDGDGIHPKRVEVIVTKDETGNILTEDVRGTGNRVMKLEKNGSDATEDKKIIIQRNGGTIQEVKPGDTQVWNTEDGKKLVFEKDVKTENVSGNRQNEMFRTTFALLLTAPKGLDVNYIYAGVGNVDGFSCDIIEAQTGGSSYKLFLDQSTHLPRMISYQAMKPIVVKFIKDEAGNKGEKQTRVFVRNGNSPKGETVEFQTKFSDYRSFGGIRLPYKWTQTVGGQQEQNIDIVNYDINPVNIADKFQDQKVYMKMKKSQ
ncbi:hypothetical protein BH20ACI1_BH20ACI1_20090 [soil metagenome]